MTGMPPVVVVTLHDVTVCAGGRIVAKIRRAARIAEREYAQAGGDSEKDGHCNRQREFHRREV